MNDKTMTNQTENFDDELLSAYVDGELTGEELALVEQRLADDPRARQWVDELRALSQEIQSLPSQTVGEDLRSTIMQRAERAMLLGTGKQQTLAPRASGSMRRWAWAAMALAATLLLSIYLPTAEQEDEKSLASSKPVPGANENDQSSPTPQLEAISAVEIIDEELAAQGGGGGGVGGDGGEYFVDSTNETDSDTAIRSRRVLSPAGVASTDMVGDKDATAVATGPTADDALPEFQVVLTLHKNSNSFEQFNQLLVSNGIAIEAAEEPNEGRAIARSNSFASRGAEKELSSELRDSESESIREEVVQEEDVLEEVVLVEASAEQIENLLKACNADTEYISAVQLVTESKRSAEGEEQAGKAALPYEQWRQWERSGQQLSQNKLKKRRRAKQSGNQSQLGRATRLNANQYQLQGNGVLNFDRKLLPQSSAPAEEESETPMQALFILQQSLTAPGEPASAGGDR